MRHIRGMHDINTHGTLAREGRLISVARDWHRINRNRSGFSEENESWDGNIDHMVLNRGTKMRGSSRNLFQDLALEKKIRAIRIKQIQESIAEMEMFAGERVPGALAELQRLKATLSQLESR